MRDKVILVDKNDQQLGLMDKLEAHQKGLLHRAFSVFLFNNKNELLMQQRALSKYHSPGLWSNTVCSHQQPSESNEQAATARLMDELGIHANPKSEFSFIYRAEFDNGLIEHELDHVLLGTFNGKCLPNPSEVKAWAYVPMPVIENDIKRHPERYTEWFKIVFSQVHKHLFHQKAA